MDALRRAHNARCRRDPAYRLASRSVAALGVVLRDRRQALGLRSRDVTRASRLPSGKLWALEAGIGNPTLRTLTAIGKAVGLAVDVRPATNEKHGLTVVRMRKCRRQRYARARCLHRERRRRDAHLEEAWRELRRMARTLSRRRQALGLTEDELAAAAGVVQMQIWKLEAALGNPTVETLVRVGRVLGLEVAWTLR